MTKREVKIYCPRCSWEPRESSRWFCSGCGHSWNTFETAATCPQCGHSHRETQCLSCHRHSPHAHWYHDFTFEVEEAVQLEVIGIEVGR